jgi:N-acetyl-beta-hexosaminidase
MEAFGRATRPASVVRSHPELADEGAWSQAQCRELAAHCRRHGIRLIPEFNCLGHQSWAKTTFPLLMPTRETALS